MGSLNKVILIGFLGRDAELRFTKGGTPVSTVSLATTETWRDHNTGDKHEQTTWHRVVLWGKAAESVSEYLKKGRQIAVEGRIQVRDWTDKEGVKRQVTEIRSDRVTLLGAGGSGERKPKEADAAYDEQPGPETRVNEPVDAPPDDEIPF